MIGDHFIAIALYQKLEDLFFTVTQIICKRFNLGGILKHFENLCRNRRGHGRPTIDSILNAFEKF